VRHACFPTLSQRTAYAAALWIHRFVLRLEEHVDLYVAPSGFVRRRLVEWGIPVERTMVVRNFTVPPAVAPPLGDRGLYLGRLSAEKGVSTLLEALRLAGDPPFDIVGGGPQEVQLRSEAASLGLRRVRFVGPIAAAEVPGAIADARYLVVPSVWDENAPLAALEAMGAGRPVVASDAGGLPELVADGRGVLVPPGSAAALADAVEAYADDVAAAAVDGRRARDFVVAESSSGTHLARLEAAYAVAIELRRRRPPRGPR
jgi:glycosyltransferase involved in cell wall biosynthesis